MKTIASARLGRIATGSGGAASSTVAGCGPACPGTNVTTRPTAMPVTTSATMIQSGPFPSMSSWAGMVVQSTFEIRSAIQVRPSRKRLDATPTMIAGIARRASRRASMCIGAASPDGTGSAGLGASCVTGTR